LAWLRHLAVNDLEFSSRLRNLRHFHWYYCADWSYAALVATNPPIELSAANVRGNVGKVTNVGFT
jgi:hypothetical protein